MIILISLIGLVFSFLLFRKASGGLSFRRPNIITMFFLVIIVFQYIGSFSLISSIVTENWWVSRASDPEDGIFWAHLSILSILIITPSTIIIIQKIIGFNPKTQLPSLYTEEAVFINNNGDRKVFHWLLFSILAVILALSYLIFSARTIPLFEALTGGSSFLVSSARIDSLGDNFLLRLINGIVGKWIAPVLLLTSLGYYLMKRSRKYYFLFFVCVISVFFVATFRTEKAPAVHLVLMLLIVRSIFKGGLKFGMLIKYGIISFIVIIAMYSIFMGVENISDVLEAIFSRIFLSQHVGTVLAFDYFPRVENFTGGSRILPFSSFFFEGEEVRSFALKMMEYYNTSAWDSGVAGYLSTSFVAEGFSYWGFIGIPVSCIIVGIFLTLVSVLSVRIRKHPVTVALIVFLMYRIPFMLNSGLNVAIYSTELIATLLFFLFFVFTVRGRAVIKYKPKYIP